MIFLEYIQAIEWGIYLTIDNLHPLTEWPELFHHQDILLRIDPGYGQGHHSYVETGGSQSKFGIPLHDIAQAESAIHGCGAHVIGLHAHSGSGILSSGNWGRIASTLAELSQKFPDATIIDLGGGLGIPEKDTQPALNLQQMNITLQSIKKNYPHLSIWLEPGRFLCAQAGVLLCRVNQIKQKASITYVGVDAGMHTLIRPALYSSYHPIVNLSKLHQPSNQLAHIVGPICESGDFLGHARWFPQTSEGDIVLIANAGAYGSSMSSQYNLRPLAKEIALQLSTTDIHSMAD